MEHHNPLFHSSKITSYISLIFFGLIVQIIRLFAQVFHIYLLPCLITSFQRVEGGLVINKNHQTVPSCNLVNLKNKENPFVSS